MPGADVALGFAVLDAFDGEEDGDDPADDAGLDFPVDGAAAERVGLLCDTTLTPTRMTASSPTPMAVPIHRLKPSFMPNA